LNISHDGDKILGNDLVESTKQSLDLFLDRRVQTILSGKLNELAAVFDRDRNACTVFLQRDELGDAELL